MKYMCLGYYDEKAWGALSEAERNTFMDDCFAYDDVLRKGGHMIGGEALQSAQSARTVRSRNGEVLVTDGPFAETREVLGGILVLEARDMDHAVQLISKHPGAKAGPFEIRAVEDMTEVMRQSALRRAGKSQ
jgi:hypothetical protein